MDGFRKVIIILSFLLGGISVAWSQNCNYNDQGNNINTSGKCAPVNLTWRVWYTEVVLPPNGTIEFEFDWDDGNPTEIVAPTGFDPLTSTYEVTVNHEYPKNGPECVYNASVRLVVNGSPCPLSTQGQRIRVYDTDNENGGRLNVLPPVYPICVGNDDVVRFVDASEWNCVPDEVLIEEGPNDRKRWIQWVYGTNHLDANFIADALVDNVARVYPFEGPVEYTSEPVYGPVPPMNECLPIYIPHGHVVGDRFEVELRNWNQCNPYDGGYDPVTTHAEALIVDLPDGSIGAAGPFCENDSPVFLIPVTPGGTWAGPGIMDETTGLFNPEAAGPGDHLISYEVTSAQGCNGSGSIIIRVNESPKPDILQGDVVSLCPGTSQSIDGNPTGGKLPYTHLWTGDIAPLNNVGIQNPQFVTTNIGTYELVYKVTDDNTCYGLDTLIIQVDTVDIHFVNKKLDLCTGVSQVLKPDPTGGSEVFIEHRWRGDRTDLLSATDVENPVFQSASPGVYKYEYYVRDSQGCEDADSIYVYVYEQPIANAGNDAVVCGDIYSFQAIPSIGAGEWSLKSGDGNVLIDDLNDPNSEVVVDAYGEYIFKWSEENSSCRDEDEVILTFYQIPAPAVGPDADTCGLTYNLTAFPDVGGDWKQISGPGSSFFEDGSMAGSSVTVDNPGDYEFAWIEDNGFGCVGGDTLKVTFYPIPTASVAPFNPNSCNPVHIDFINTSLGADSYHWDFGDGFVSNEENPGHTFKNYTQILQDYEIELVAVNSYGCSDTLKQLLEVAPRPVARMDISQGPGCSPLVVDFISQSEGGTSCVWDMDDGNPEITTPDVTHTFVNDQNYVMAYEVELVVENDYGCTDTAKTYVTVYPLSTYGITASPVQGCHPMRVDFIADPGAYSYNWEFGDGHTVTGTNSVSHIYENTTGDVIDYTARLYSTSAFGCKDTSELSLRVNPSPVSLFQMTPADGCAPVDIAFTNESLDAQLSLWRFGDGTELSVSGNGSVNHLFENDGLGMETYNVSLMVENSFGCQDSTVKTVKVYPEVEAGIGAVDNGCTPHEVSIANNSTGANSFVWNYGDGNVSNGLLGKHIYINNSLEDQEYQIVLTAVSSFGCEDKAVVPVTVYRTPQPSFDVAPVSQQMPNSTITLGNTTMGSGWTFHWDLGDGNSSDQSDLTSHIYNKSGLFNVVLTARGEHCENSAFKQIEIIPSLPDIVYGSNAEGCPPLTVQFTNETVDAYNFMWEFGDGNVSSEKEPEHTYYTPGNYRVKLTASGPGGIMEADEVVVEVYEKPNAFFDAVPAIVKIPGQSVSFINKSTDAVNSLWNLGDGSVSSEYSLMYEYQEPGVYDISLDVTNELGCKDTYLKREAVIAEMGGEIKFPNAFTPNPNNVIDLRVMLFRSTPFLFCQWCLKYMKLMVLYCLMYCLVIGTKATYLTT
ncbi:PKD domain-containing protein [Marinilabiliaceae bacterium JC017]|nr:PKD domain-containing protein [Marinilabiliaceae bacterium JC017]